METTTLPQRERKFKVWDIQKKSFIPNDVYAIITSDFNAFGIMLKDWENYKEGECFYKSSQILIDYVGLHDKNGKGREVYQWDVYFEEDEQDGGDIRTYFIVMWIKEWAMFSLLTNGERVDYEDNGIEALDGDGLINTFIMSETDLGMMHYAGNIFEQPELLKK